METKKIVLIIINFNLMLCSLSAQFDAKQSYNRIKTKQTQPQPSVIQQAQKPTIPVSKEETISKEVKKNTPSNSNQEAQQLKTKQSSLSMEAMKNPPPEKKKGGVFTISSLTIASEGIPDDLDGIYGIINLEITKTINGQNVPIAGGERKDIYFNDGRTRCINLGSSGLFGVLKGSGVIDFDGQGIAVNIKPEDIENAEVHIGFYLVDKDANVDWAKGDGDDDIFTFLNANQAHGRYVYPNNWSVYHFPLSKATGNTVKLEFGNGSDIISASFAPIFKSK